MPIASQIVGLVLAIAIAQFLIWVPIVLWLRARHRRALAALHAEIAAGGERVVRGPSKGVYRGATDRYGRVNGNGTALLTDKRLAFRKVTGGAVDVALADVAGVGEMRAFLGKVTPNRVVVLTTKDGVQVGFVFGADHAGWMDQLRSSVVGG